MIEKESEELQNELNIEKSKLNDENELKDVKNTLFEEKTNLQSDLGLKLKQVQHKLKSKADEVQTR